MSDEELNGLMEDDLESRFNPIENMKSLKVIQYEISNIPKVRSFV
jgi:predicted metallopeptidase